jgi:hypothetical protein
VTPDARPARIGLPDDWSSLTHFVMLGRPTVQVRRDFSAGVDGGVLVGGRVTVGLIRRLRRLEAMATQAIARRLG